MWLLYFLQILQLMLVPILEITCGSFPRPVTESVLRISTHDYFRISIFLQATRVSKKNDFTWRPFVYVELLNCVGVAWLRDTNVKKRRIISHQPKGRFNFREEGGKSLSNCDIKTNCNIEDQYIRIFRHMKDLETLNKMIFFVECLI